MLLITDTYLSSVPFGREVIKNNNENPSSGKANMIKGVHEERRKTLFLNYALPWATKASLESETFGWSPVNLIFIKASHLTAISSSSDWQGLLAICVSVSPQGYKGPHMISYSIMSPSNFKIAPCWAESHGRLCSPAEGPFDRNKGRNCGMYHVSWGRALETDTERSIVLTAVPALRILTQSPWRTFHFKEFTEDKSY